MEAFQARPVGDSGLLFVFGSQMEAAVNRRAVALARRLRRLGHPGIVDIVPAYSTVLVVYEPWRLDPEEVASLACQQGARGEPDGEEGPPGSRVIPCLYGGEFGPDLDQVAEIAGISPEEVIGHHTRGEYQVFCLGFTPGFPYMGPVDQAITVPRLESPRSRVPAGTVGLAGSQTGIYSMEAPGGWRLIGRTPIRMFDPDRERPALISPGDRVSFRALTPPEFSSLREEPPGPRVESPSRPGLRILRPGLQTTVQDLGRRGFMHLGVSRAGAADLGSCALANRLVGNPPDRAVLEVTAQGPDIEFLTPCRVSVTGAEMEARIDGEPLAVGASARAVSGSRLTFGALEKGLRAYVGVSGGIDVPPVMGSRATDTVAGLGGLAGRPLKEGDLLGLGPPGEAGGLGAASPRGVPGPGEVFTVRAVPGPQEDHFDRAAWRLLEESDFRVEPASDRMGLRLRGPEPLPHSERGPGILSEGILPGSVQVPGNGHPIVMLGNAQTTGGYAKIATVISPDLALLAQARPGDRVRFRLVDEAQARRAAAGWWRELTGQGGTRYLVEVDGRRLVVEIRE